jgi:hypothetical protein
VEFGGDAAALAVELASELLSCVTALDSSGGSSFPTVSDLTSIATCGSSGSNTMTAVLALKSTIEAVMDTDALAALLSTGKISQPLCAALWDDLDARMNLYSCMSVLAANMPSADLCFYNGWSKPATLLSSVLSAVLGGQSVAGSLGVWVDQDQERGCFVSAAAGFKLSLPTVEGGFMLGVMESKTAVCGTSIAVDVGATVFGVSGTVSMDFQPSYSFGDMPTGVQGYGQVEDAVFNAEVGYHYSYTNSVGYAASSSINDPSSSSYCSQTDIVSQAVNKLTGARVLLPAGPAPPPIGAAPWVRPLLQRTDKLMRALNTITGVSNTTMRALGALHNAPNSTFANAQFASVSAQLQALDAQRRAAADTIRDFRRNYLLNVSAARPQEFGNMSDIIADMRARLTDLETSVLPLAGVLEANYGALDSLIVTNADWLGVYDGTTAQAAAAEAELATADDVSTRSTVAAAVGAGAGGIALGMMLLAVWHGCSRARRTAAASGVQLRHVDGSNKEVAAVAVTVAASDVPQKQ